MAQGGVIPRMQSSYSNNQSGIYLSNFNVNQIPDNQQDLNHQLHYNFNNDQHLRVPQHAQSPQDTNQSVEYSVSRTFMYCNVEVNQNFHKQPPQQPQPASAGNFLQQDRNQFCQKQRGYGCKELDLNNHQNTIQVDRCMQPRAQAHCSQPGTSCSATWKSDTQQNNGHNEMQQRPFRQQPMRKKTVEERHSPLNNLQRFLSNPRLPSREANTNPLYHAAWNARKMLGMQNHATDQITNRCNLSRNVGCGYKTNQTPVGNPFFRQNPLEPPKSFNSASRSVQIKQKSGPQSHFTTHVTNPISILANQNSPAQKSKITNEPDSPILKPFVDFNRVKDALSEFPKEMLVETNSHPEQPFVNLQATNQNIGFLKQSSSSNDQIQSSNFGVSDLTPTQQPRLCDPQEKFGSNPNYCNLDTGNVPPTTSSPSPLLSGFVQQRNSRSHSVDNELPQSPKYNFIRPSSAPSTHSASPGRNSSNNFDRAESSQCHAAQTSEPTPDHRVLQQSIRDEKVTSNKNNSVDCNVIFRKQPSTTFVKKELNVDAQIVSKPKHPCVVGTKSIKIEGSSSSCAYNGDGDKTDDNHEKINNVISINLAEAFSPEKTAIVKTEKDIPKENINFVFQSNNNKGEQLSEDASFTDKQPDEKQITKIQEEVEDLLRMGLPNYNKHLSADNESLQRIFRKKSKRRRTCRDILQPNQIVSKRRLSTLSNDECDPTLQPEKDSFVKVTKETSEITSTIQHNVRMSKRLTESTTSGVFSPTRKRSARISLSRSKSPRMDLVYEQQLSALHRSLSPIGVDSEAKLPNRVKPCQVWLTDIFSTEASIVRITRS